MANISITSYSAICDLGTNIKEIFENSLLAGKNFFTPDENIIKGKKVSRDGAYIVSSCSSFILSPMANTSATTTAKRPKMTLVM